MNTFKPLQIDAANSLLKQENAHLIDIRDEDTFKQGHIPGAQHLTREALVQFLADQPKDQTYIVCCYRGNSSKQVAQILCDSGFSDVYNLEGGFTAWQQAANNHPEYEVELDA